MKKRDEILIFTGFAVILTAASLFINVLFSLLLFLLFFFLIYRKYIGEKKMINVEKDKTFLTEKYMVLEERNMLLLSSDSKMVVFYDSDFNIV